VCEREIVRDCARESEREREREREQLPLETPRVYDYCDIDEGLLVTLVLSGAPLQKKYHPDGKLFYRVAVSSESRRVS
jgi:hypothetical protein